MISFQISGINPQMNQFHGNFDEKILNKKENRIYLKKK